MKLKQSLAAVAVAGVLAGTLGTGTAFAESNTPNGSTTPKKQQVLQKACARLTDLTTAEGKLKANIDDRISILQGLKDGSGPKAVARIDKRIKRLEAQKTALDKKLAKLTAKCAASAA